ncbi:alanyl-tRNA editing protein [Pseudomonas sp. 148P]|uniref:Alanyl-tRNA editing protein n=1 Tax=Pseudomonas ulcerans TaxID=3115852 RepID=A0ABU7HNU5_9PSED|nr:MULTISPECIES: alanyl-tRNA editing protein [unclassified Pseudomonas]MEE1923680.1 alanyl-tRNA editing protein [Pseudomonas sp. 147P]MEE1933178.1 alanyl-tRNA editing protein [Pseudomonas sp. 148P]
MTQRAYFFSDELTLETRVLACRPLDDGRYQVVMAETLFHPQGGGQLADQGFIDGVAVEAVVQTENEVLHTVAQAIPSGPVQIKVAADVRLLHARLHSAGHLLACVGERAGWRAVKGHHWPGECRVVFERQPQAEEMTAESLEQALNRLIAADQPRHLRDENGMRSVGFGSLPMHGCGGTHVLSTGVIAGVRILKMKEKKGQLSVHYDVVEGAA